MARNPLIALLRSHLLILQRSKLFEICEKEDPSKGMCSNPFYLDNLCEIFPITVIKFVRIGMSMMETLLSDEDIENLHVIYLVRDPRAVMSSRWNKKKTSWCKGPECPNETVFCDDIDEDLTAAKNLHSKFPDRIHLIRFEDIALKPKEMSLALYDEIGISFTKEVEEYVHAHTTQNSQVAESTIKVSKTRVISWAREMSWPKVQKVQKACKNAMERYGYNLAEENKNITVENIIQSFNPFEDDKL